MELLCFRIIPRHLFALYHSSIYTALYTSLPCRFQSSNFIPFHSKPPLPLVIICHSYAVTLSLLGWCTHKTIMPFVYNTISKHFFQLLLLKLHNNTFRTNLAFSFLSSIALHMSPLSTFRNTCSILCHLSELCCCLHSVPVLQLCFILPLISLIHSWPS